MSLSSDTGIDAVALVSQQIALVSIYRSVVDVTSIGTLETVVDAGADADSNDEDQQRRW